MRLSNTDKVQLDDIRESWWKDIRQLIQEKDAEIERLLAETERMLAERDRLSAQCERTESLDEPFIAAAPPPPQSDNVNHPSHYKQGDIECIDAIESALTPEGFSAYCLGNAIKYIWRSRNKGGREDLEKAEWYLKRVIDTT